MRDLHSQRLIILSNLNLWVIQLLFLELLDFRIPAHTYCQPWGWEQGLHIWLKTVTFPVAVWHQKWERFLQLGILKAEQNRAGGALKSSVVGPESDSIEFFSFFLWLWWSFEDFLFFTSVRVRAELGQRCELGVFFRGVEMVLAEAWEGVAVQSGLFYKYELQNLKMAYISCMDSWLLRLFICSWSLVCAVRFYVPCHFQSSWNPSGMCEVKLGNIQKLCALSKKCIQNKSVMLF